MTIIPARTPREEMLVRGLSDLGQMIEIEDVVKRHYKIASDEAVEEGVNDLVSDMLEQGLFRDRLYSTGSERRKAVDGILRVDRGSVSPRSTYP